MSVEGWFLSLLLLSFLGLLLSHTPDGMVFMVLFRDASFMFTSSKSYIEMLTLVFCILEKRYIKVIMQYKNNYRKLRLWYDERIKANAVAKNIHWLLAAIRMFKALCECKYGM